MSYVYAAPLISWQKKECHQMISQQNAGTWGWLCEQAGMLKVDTPTEIKAKIHYDYPKNSIIDTEAIFSRDQHLGFSIQIAGQHLTSNEEWQILKEYTSFTIPIHIRFFSKNVQSGRPYHLPSGTLAIVSTKNHLGEEQQTELNISPFMMVPKVNSCQFVNKHMTVKLPDLNMNEIYRKMGQEILRQEIPLMVLTHCPNDIQAYISFTDANDWSNTSTILTNMGDAKGVGVQLYHNQQAIKLDRPPMPQSFVEQPNTLPLQHQSTQAELKRFALGYVKTGETVKAGTISSSILINVYYK